MLLMVDGEIDTWVAKRAAATFAIDMVVEGFDGFERCGICHGDFIGRRGPGRKCKAVQKTLSKR